MNDGPTFGSLFAGIGGLDLGLERAGWRCRWQVELDPFCGRVLEKHWPAVARWRDIRDFINDLPRVDGLGVDLICGGFPCQPVSHNGHQRADEDERWLWPEFFRVVRVLRPRYVLVENVAGLLATGMGQVLGDLASIGYDAEWASIRAADVEAPHRRERVFIVADADRLRCEAGEGVFAGRAGEGLQTATWRGISRRGVSGRLWRFPDGEIHGVADGLPDELVRLRAYGNSVVPDVAEWIGRRLMAAQSRAVERSSPTVDATPTVVPKTQCSKSGGGRDTA